MKSDTENILLFGGLAVAAYLILSKKTVVPVAPLLPGQTAVAVNNPANPTGNIISSLGPSITSIISDLFKPSDTPDPNTQLTANDISTVQVTDNNPGVTNANIFDNFMATVNA